MKNEKIFKQAIEKAIKNGYNSLNCIKDGKLVTGYSELGWKPIKGMIYGVIFSHDFAKAFWGEREVINDGYSDFVKKLLTCVKMNKKDYMIENEVREGWQYHLQQMVLEKEPLHYLKKYL